MSDTPRTDDKNNELLDFDSYASWLEMSAFARQLERELNAANDRIKRLEEEYHDLIMQVERKFDGETRHETAKRYIRNAEAVKLDIHEAEEAKP